MDVSRDVFGGVLQDLLHHVFDQLLTMTRCKLTLPIEVCIAELPSILDGEKIVRFRLVVQRARNLDFRDNP